MDKDRSSLFRLRNAIVDRFPMDMSPGVAEEWLDDPAALDQLIGRLREGTVPVTQIQTCEFGVLIYPERTVEQWVDACRGWNQDKAVINRRFGRFLTTNKDATEPYKQKVVAFNLGLPATIAKAVRIRKRLGLKPVGLEHVAAVGEQCSQVHPEIRCIVNPDAVEQGLYGNLQALCLNSDPDNNGYDDRELRLFGTNMEEDDYRDREWLSSAWFFGLRE